MTAYGFKRQFVDPLRAGTKIGTIRKDGGRPHAKPGGLIQLYCEMRRPTCFKIRPDVVCQRVNTITIDIRMSDRADLWAGSIIWSNGVALKSVVDLDAFAVGDGFADFAAMAAFWSKTHGDDIFHGSHIIWGPLPAYAPGPGAFPVG